MKVTKRRDIAAMIRRDEEERKARERLAGALAADTPERVMLDLFETCKGLVAASLEYVPFDPAIQLDAYDGLEDFRVRLANQGVEAEWRDILPPEMKGLYGKEGA